MAAQAMRTAVVGAGWAGLAAAVRRVQAGDAVTLYETTRGSGGRSRSLERDGATFDNGQHILIGAYLRTLDLMQTVGVNPEAVLLRLPLTLRYPDGRDLTLAPGRPVPALLRGLAHAKGLGWYDRAALLAAAGAWALRGFRCNPAWTVAELCRRLPHPVRAQLIDPLCVAALNTPAQEASAAVFLRVLHDALLSGPGSADLLLPRQPLAQLLPRPALRWLESERADVRLGERVQALERQGDGWRVNGERFDVVILACTAAEASRLAGPHASAEWIADAAAMSYEPIITVYIDAPGARLPTAMFALSDGTDEPAQFVFDHGVIAGRDGLLACVVSGARRWVEAGLEVTGAAALAQVKRELAPWLGAAESRVLHTLAEKRATFRCVPLLRRPALHLASGLLACGDYIDGPYPATLEGAVRAGEAAAAAAPSRSGPAATEADARIRRP